MVAEEVKTISELAQLGAGIAIGFGAIGAGAGIGIATKGLMDAISRLIPGVLNNDVSAEFESFQDNLLEYPQYTRPEEFLGHKVPEVLLSGHHANIDKFRREQSILRTKKNRPDLFEKAMLENMKEPKK